MARTAATAAAISSGVRGSSGWVIATTYREGSRATLTAPLWAWSARAANASRQAERPNVWVTRPARSTRPRGGEVEVVLDAVAPDAVHLLDAEGVGADPADLLEVERAPLPAAGGMHAALDQRAPGPQHPHLDLERLRLADGVVGHVDAAGVAHGQPVEALHGGAQHAAATRPPAAPPARPARPGGTPHGRPARPASAAWASWAATTPTSTSGCSARRMATAQQPSAPAPHTSARPPGGGGCRVTLWSETAKGSARMARRSSSPSGTANNIVEWAGISSA